MKIIKNWSKQITNRPRKKRKEMKENRAALNDTNNTTLSSQTNQSFATSQDNTQNKNKNIEWNVKVREWTLHNRVDLK